MVAPSKHMDPWSHEQVPILARWLHEELNSSRKHHGQCSIEGVPASEAIRIIKRAPTEGTHYDHWHQTVYPTLLADAQVAWDRKHQGQQQAAPVPAMSGEHVIEYYVERLAAHFKLDRERYYQQHYKELHQQRRAPTHLLADMQQCWPHLRNVQPERFAADFVQKLDPAIREDMQRRIVVEPLDTWFSNLSRIANEANVAWDNYRQRQLIFDGVDPTAATAAAGPSSSTAATRGSTSSASSSGNAKSKKFYCSEHGANDTHATADCNVLRRRQQRTALVTAASGASTSSPAPAASAAPGPGNAQLLQAISMLAAAGHTAAAAALVTGAATKWQAEAEKRVTRGGAGRGQGKPEGKAPGGGSERCEHCDRVHPGVCFIVNPLAAPAGWRFRGARTQERFEAALAKAKGGDKGGAAANVTDCEDFEDFYSATATALSGDTADECGSMKPWFLLDAAPTRTLDAEPDDCPVLVTAACALPALELHGAPAEAGQGEPMAPWFLISSHEEATSGDQEEHHDAREQPEELPFAERHAWQPVRLVGVDHHSESVNAGGADVHTASALYERSKWLRERLLQNLLCTADHTVITCATGTDADREADAAYAAGGGEDSMAADGHPAATAGAGAAGDAGAGAAAQLSSSAALATLRQQPAPLGFRPTVYMGRPGVPFTGLTMPEQAGVATTADLIKTADAAFRGQFSEFQRALADESARLLGTFNMWAAAALQAEARRAAAGSAEAALASGFPAAPSSVTLQHDTRVPYFACNAPTAPDGTLLPGFRTVSDIPEQEWSALMQRHPRLARYFARPHKMFYCQPGDFAIEVKGRNASGAGGSRSDSAAADAPQPPIVLRDHSASVSLVTKSFCTAHRLPFRATGATLSTAASGGAEGPRPLHELVTERLQLRIKPGSPYSVVLPLTKTLVVEDTYLFDVLLGNEQMQPVASYVTVLPEPRLHFYPNLVEYPSFVVSMALCNSPGARAALAAAERYIVCYASLGDTPSPKLGGGCNADLSSISDITAVDSTASTSSSAAPTCSDAGVLKAGGSDASPGEFKPSCASGARCACAGGNASGPSAGPSDSGKAATKEETATDKTGRGSATTATDPATALGGSAKAQGWVARGLSTVSGWISKGAAFVSGSMDRTVPICQKEETPKRTGKRKKYRPPPVERQVGAKRSWFGLTVFMLYAIALISLAARVGAVGGSAGGTPALQALQQVEAVTNALAVAPPHLRMQWDLAQEPGQHWCGAGPPGLSHVLASVESFSFDGKMAAAASERYEKDKDGGWIWGNAVAMTPDQAALLRAQVRARRSTSFAYSMEELPGYSGGMGPFRLELTTDKPIIQSPRRYSPKEQEIIRAKTDELLKPGICVEWTGPTLVAVNPVIAAKRDEATGLWTAARMAQDYRPVNKSTRGDKYGLHRPEDIFQRVGKARFFSKLDMRQGFLQIPIHPDDHGKTAFWCGNRLIAYTRMPYGLKNASAAFQRRMDYELRAAGLDHVATAFIDDVLIATETAEEHIEAVGRVLDALAACGLRAHPDKSIFGADVVEYLGHNLSTFGISPHQAKVAAIQALQPPRNVSELRTQLGFINYYRCYIPRMSEIAAPLNSLLKAGAAWQWGIEQEQAHRELKEIFMRPDVVLRRIDYTRQLIVHTDFSNKGIAAVLGQLDNDGREYMCACISRSLNKHEANYSSYKGEMLAAVWALKMFRHHLIGSDTPFKLVTDHQPLLHLMSSEGLTGQYARFALVLQEYNFVVEHRPGVTHQNADGLSRNPLPSSADGSGARLDEDEPQSGTFGSQEPPTAAAVAASLSAQAVLHAALSTSVPVAPFSSDFIPSADEALAGWNGWAFESAAPPPDAVDREGKAARMLLRSAALEWRAAFKLRRRTATAAPLAPTTPAPEAVTAAAWYDEALRKGLTLWEATGGLGGGLDACLLNGIPVQRYYYSDQSPAARAALKQRLSAVTDLRPDLFPATAWSASLTAMPPSVGDATEEHLRQLAFGGQPVLIIAHWSSGDTVTQAAVLKMLRTARRLLGEQRVMFISSATFSVSETPPPEQRDADAATREVWGKPLVADAARFGSGFHQLNRTWTTLAVPTDLRDLVEAAHRPASSDVQACLGDGRNAPVAVKQLRAPFYPCDLEGKPVKALLPATIPATVTAHQPTAACPIQDLVQGCYTPPTADECERLLGFEGRASGAPNLTEVQRKALLASALDVSYLASIIAIGRVLAEDAGPSTSASAAALIVRAGGTSGIAAPFTWSPLAADDTVVSALASAALEPEASPQEPSAKEAWADEAMLNFLRGNGTLPPGMSETEQRRVRRRASRYRWQGDQLYISLLDGKLRLVPRPEERGELVRRTHEQSGHFGVRRTTALLLHTYWWPGVVEDVRAAVKHCEACDRVKASYLKHQAGLQPLPIGGLFYRWGVDLCGPFNETAHGNKYVMVCIEHFSKFVLLVPIPSKHARDTAFAFQHRVLGVYGACAEVCTDQGSEWKGEFASMLLNALIDHRQTSANHPQANGLTERAVQTCKKALTKLALGAGAVTDWDQQLPSITLGYNCSVQSSTKLCPYTIVFATDPVVPPAAKPRFEGDLDLDDPEAAARSVMLRAAAVRKNMVIAGGNLAVAQHRDKLHYAKLRGGGYDPKVRRLEVGDYVYYRNTTERTALEAQAKPDILRVHELRPSGVVILEGRCGTKISTHCTHVAPCHLPIADGSVDPRLARPSVTLACEVCLMPDNEEWMLLCDSCGTGWHTFCLTPPLEKIPEGTWVCPSCTTKGVTPDTLRQAQRQGQAASTPPAKFRNLQGAMAMREAKGRRARSVTNTGVVSYAGQRRRVHYFLIEYPDGATETVTHAQLRPRLVPKQQERAAAITSAGPAASPSSEEPPARGVSLPQSTPSELECLSELVDLSRVTSVYAPLNVSDATAAWVRAHGCTLRRGRPTNGAAALETASLRRAQQDGIGMNVIWLEVDPSTVDAHVEAVRNAVTDAVIARVPREYVGQAGKARLSWLRKRRASGELLIASCATCVWLVLLSKDMKRWGFVTAMSAGDPVL